MELVHVVHVPLGVLGLEVVVGHGVCFTPVEDKLELLTYLYVH
jgi:hypothetical protein